jgi:phospholipase C
LNRARTRFGRVRWAGGLAVVVAAAVAAVTGVFAADLGARPNDGIHRIKHVVVIMQENRSFDSYFGTYPEPTASR